MIIRRTCVLVVLWLLVLAALIAAQQMNLLGVESTTPAETLAAIPPAAVAAAPSSGATRGGGRCNCCSSARAAYEATLAAESGEQAVAAPAGEAAEGEHFVAFKGKDQPEGLTTEQQLRWWDERHSATDANLTYTNLNATLWGGGASRAQIDRTTADYRRRATALGDGATPTQRMQALLDAVTAELGGDESNVCRHYSYLLYKVAVDLGFPVEFRCYGLTGNGHCWNRVTIGGTQFVVSANWGFFYAR